MNMLCETNRLFLKILRFDSAKIVLDFYERNRDFLEPFEPDRVPLFYTETFHQTNLNYEYNLMCGNRMLRYWIFDKQRPGKIIGSVCLQHIIKGAFLSCVVSYKMDKDYLRNGYATEALSTLITIAFSVYGLHRIEAYIVEDNLASIKLVSKFGFLPEGIAHSSVCLQGIWVDQIRYALINQALK